jgi:hypothetical protein
MAMGGGEYERRKSFLLTGGVTAVTQGGSLQSALGAVAGGGIVEIGDSGRYKETLTIKLNEAAKLELRAANEHRPALILGDDLDIELGPEAELTLNGLLVSGGVLRVLGSGADDRPRYLRLRHCTLVPGLAFGPAGEPASPGTPSLVIDAPNTTVEIDSCVLGGMRCRRDSTVRISNSIIDATAFNRIAFAHEDGISAGGILSVTNSTMIGKVYTARMDLASNTLFLARLAPADGWAHPVLSDQNQQGCVRFSFVPLNAIVPRRYRCQPDLAVASAITAADVPKGSLTDANKQAITVATQARVRPAFTTLRYGQPGYCQLGSYCPKEIRAGAEDESEMGAFHDVFAPQREGNLRIRLEEYLRFGLEAGVFYAS